MKRILFPILFAIAAINFSSCKGEKPIWEITVIDKYSDIGSNFHLIGGRTSETQYVIVTKSVLIKQGTGIYHINNDHLYNNSVHEIHVSGHTYRNTTIGTKYIENNFFPQIY